MRERAIKWDEETGIGWAQGCGRAMARYSGTPDVWECQVSACTTCMYRAEQLWKMEECHTSAMSPVLRRDGKSTVATHVYCCFPEDIECDKCNGKGRVKG